MYKLKAAEWRPQHFKWQVAERVATITLNRPERKNPLTFESYAELRKAHPEFVKDMREGTPPPEMESMRWLVGTSTKGDHHVAIT